MISVRFGSCVATASDIAKQNELTTENDFCGTFARQAAEVQTAGPENEEA